MAPKAVPSGVLQTAGVRTGLYTRASRWGIGTVPAVIARLGGHAGAEQRLQVRESEEDLAVSVLGKGGCGCRGSATGREWVSQPWPESGSKLGARVVRQDQGVDRVGLLAAGAVAVAVVVVGSGEGGVIARARRLPVCRLVTRRPQSSQARGWARGRPWSGPVTDSDAAKAGAASLKLAIATRSRYPCHSCPFGCAPGQAQDLDDPPDRCRAVSLPHRSEDVLARSGFNRAVHGDELDVPLIVRRGSERIGPW